MESQRLNMQLSERSLHELKDATTWTKWIDQEKGYVTKLENLLSPYAQKYAHEASAAPLIDEATLLIATANATVDQLTLENRAADIIKTARVKIKYLTKCLDEEKVSLCQKLFQELEKLVEPLLDTKLISLDSVVQFYPEYEDIAERYKAEIGIIQLNKQMSVHSAKISFLLKCLSNEMGERGDISKVQSYVKKLQLAVEPLTQFDGYAPADELVEQVKTNIYEAEACRGQHSWTSIEIHYLIRSYRRTVIASCPHGRCSSGHKIKPHTKMTGRFENQSSIFSRKEFK